MSILYTLSIHAANDARLCRSHRIARLLKHVLKPARSDAKAEDLAHELLRQAEKEKRVAQLHRMAARRFANAGLIRGWQGWQAAWAERQRHRRMLASAAGRLQRPQLAACLTHWRVDWQEEARAALEEGQRLLRAEQSRRDEKHGAELDALRADLKAAQESLAAERKEWEAQRVTQTLSAEAEMQKQLLEQLEEQKEKRVAHLQQQAARRMGQADLANGWSVWWEQWEEVSRQKRMLAAAGAKLSRPGLVAAFEALSSPAARGAVVAAWGDTSRPACPRASTSATQPASASVSQ
mgnify:CR=1 FL=1